MDFFLSYIQILHWRSNRRILYCLLYALFMRSLMQYELIEWLQQCFIIPNTWCWAFSNYVTFLFNRYHRVFNKKSGRWTVHAMRERKKYEYMSSLLCDAVKLRINDRVGMKKTVLAPDDPRLIAKHLAPVEPPPTEELVLQQKSRFWTATEIKCEFYIVKKCEIILSIVHVLQQYLIEIISCKIYICLNLVTNPFYTLQLFWSHVVHLPCKLYSRPIYGDLH